jgi:hypothetical protein
MDCPRGKAELKNIRAGRSAVHACRGCGRVRLDRDEAQLAKDMFRRGGIAWTDRRRPIRFAESKTTGIGTEESSHAVSERRN